ncbi:MAG: PIN domain-containing protein [Myxococcota bacterium]
MKALDTNVLVRFFVEDHAEQAERARRAVLAARERGEPLFVPDLAVVELVWVLRSRYRLPVSEARALVGAMLASPDFQFSHRDRLARAHRSWCDGKGDFADYVMREAAREAGCDALLTFDGAIAGEAGFEAL